MLKFNVLLVRGPYIGISPFGWLRIDKMDAFVPSRRHPPTDRGAAKEASKIWPPLAK